MTTTRLRAGHERENPAILGNWRALADYHTHTVYSRPTHARGTVEDNVRTALKRGLRELAITDHGPAGLWYGIGGPEQFSCLEAELERVQMKYPDLRLLLGIEANLVSLDGDIDVSDELLERLDVLLVGFHPHVRMRTPHDFVSLVGRNALSTGIPALAPLFPHGRRQNTRALVRAVERYPVDIVTHPGLRIDIDTAELARACAAKKTFVEINSAHRNTTVDFIRIAKDAGAQFVVSSDAHDPDRVGEVRWALRLAQSAGLDPRDIANVVNVDDSGENTHSADS